VEQLVFTPFFTTKDQGHGLGLAIVHRIVYEHFGAVDMETVPGKGTRFKVWFPRLGSEGASPARASTGEVVHV